MYRSRLFVSGMFRCALHSTGIAEQVGPPTEGDGTWVRLPRDAEVWVRVPRDT